MKNVIILCKPLGLTPLQTIDKFRVSYPEYSDMKLSYAGRLDPMAEGVMLVLAGDENKKRHEYENLEKEYEFEVLFGVATDTYDILGLITDWKNNTLNQIDKNVLGILPSFNGEYSQPFPPYSSKPVNGKPLYWWARAGRLSEIAIPERTISIYSLKYLGKSEVDISTLEKRIYEKIALVKGDFRQDVILSAWRNFFAESGQQEYTVMKFSIVCSSGTYVRSLAKRIGNTIDIPSLAISIKRTRVGKHSLSDCIKLD